MKYVKLYRSCGILFLVMTAALAGMVILLLHSEGGKKYPGFTIYAVAAYTFYKIIMSVIHMLRVRRQKSPLLMAIRDIGIVVILMILILGIRIVCTSSDVRRYE